MAAVVASLAGIFVGCSLPVQPGSGRGGRAFVTGDPAEERDLGGGGDGRSDVWSQSRQTASLGIAAEFAEALTIKSDVLKVVATQACPHEEPLAVVPIAPALVPARPVLKRGASDEAGAGKVDGVASSARRVHFDLTKLTEHEITPYSEVYNGVHPRDFNFGKGLPAPFTCFVDPRAKALPAWRGVNGYDSDDEEDEDGGIRRARAKGRRVLGFGIPQHMWVALCLLCFMVRAFGVTAIMEILPDLPEVAIMEILPNLPEVWHLKLT